MTLSPRLAVAAPSESDARPFRSSAGVGGWVDGVLVVCLLSAVVTEGLFWDVEPSRPRDLLASALLLSVSLAGKPWRRISSTIVALAFGLLAMTATGLLVWDAYLGADLALNFWTGYSPWLPSAAFLVFGLAYGQCRWLAWSRILVVFAVGVAAVQFVGLVALWAGQVSAGGSPDGAFYGVRPIQASLALLMVLGFTLAVASPLASEVWAPPVGAFLGISIVLSQHRSVWAALIVVLLLAIALLWRSRKAYRRACALWVTAGFMILAAVLPPLVGVSILPSTKVNEISAVGLPDVVSSTHSLQWRLDMWSSSLSAPRGFLNWVFGGVLTVNPVKWPGEGVANPQITSHNMAIDVLVMLGFAGLSVLAVLFVAATLLRPDRLVPEAIFLWSLAAFGMFYPWPSWSWLILGSALASTPPWRHGRKERRSAIAPPT